MEQSLLDWNTGYWVFHENRLLECASSRMSELGEMFRGRINPLHSELFSGLGKRKSVEYNNIRVRDKNVQAHSTYPIKHK